MMQRFFPTAETVSLPIADAQKGSALLEALIAIVVFSLGLLALAGAQANAIRAQGEAKARADAAFVANQVIGDLWSVAPNQLAGSEADRVFKSGAGHANHVATEIRDSALAVPPASAVVGKTCARRQR